MVGNPAWTARYVVNALDVGNGGVRHGPHALIVQIRIISGDQNTNVLLCHFLFSMPISISHISFGFVYIANGAGVLIPI